MYICEIHFQISRIMDRLNAVLKWLKPFLNKYLITCLVFVVFVVFVDENNAIKRWKYQKEISGLKKEIRHYRDMSEKSEKQLKRLQSVDAELERVAREEYLMKKPNEEVFLIE